MVESLRPAVIDPAFDKYNGDEKLRLAMKNRNEYNPKKDIAPTEPRKVNAEDYKNYAKKLVKNLAGFFKAVLPQPTQSYKAESLNEAFFTHEGTAEMNKLGEKYGKHFIDDSIAVVNELINIENKGKEITYKQLCKAVQKVCPDADGSTKILLQDAIMDNWINGEDIREDFYSQLSPETVKRYKLRAFKEKISKMSDEALVDQYMSMQKDKEEKNCFSIDEVDLDKKEALVAELLNRDYQINYCGIPIRKNSEKIIDLEDYI